MLEKKNPESSTFLFYLGKAYLEKKKTKKADDLFQKSLENEPAFYQSVVARALIREQKGDLKGALKILKDYLEEVDFENFAILTRATQIMFELNMIEEITPYLEEMLRQDPENLNLKVRLGIIYSETNSFNKAKSIFETILKKKSRTQIGFCIIWGLCISRQKMLIRRLTITPKLSQRVICISTQTCKSDYLSERSQFR